MSVHIELIQEDITKIETEAIVNAANSTLLGGGGVDGAIHRKGGGSILEECRQIVNRQGLCPTGDAVITTAGNLPSKYVIHTVGPIWKGGKSGEFQKLKNCYINSLKLAEQYHLKSIAFPNISTEVYGFPIDLAAHLAIETVKAYLAIDDFSHSLQKIVFVCYDTQNFRLYQDLLNS